MKAESLFIQRAQQEMTGKFCEDNTPAFVDSECARGSWLSTRGAVAMRPIAQLGDLIDSRRAVFVKFLTDSITLGVKWEATDQINIKVGHGHMTLSCDGVISSGWPDYPQRKMIVRFSLVNKTELSAIRKDGLSEQSRSQSQLLMASGGIPYCLHVAFCPFTGDYNFIMLDGDLNRARTIWDVCNNGVASDSIPPNLASNGDKVNDKCLSCSFSVPCMAPVIPAVTCRSCRHSVLGGNGSIVCGPQNNFNLDADAIQNLHRCPHHRYRAGLISTWAIEEGQTGNNEFTYSNLLNGSKFVNGDSAGQYSSYEMASTKGSDAASLIGDKGIDKLKKTFGAMLDDRI